jgi:integrase
VNFHPSLPWCKELIDAWIRDTVVTEGKVFRQVSQNGTRQDEGVTTDVVWYAVKQYAQRIGIEHLAAHDLRRYAESRIMPNFNAARAWIKEEPINGSA